MIGLVLRRCDELPEWTLMYLHGLKDYEEINFYLLFF